MSKAIGWIGLGKMGEPMAGNLLREGFDLSVFNRSREKAAALEAAGAKVADTAAELAGKVDILFLMLSDDRALRAVSLGETGVIAQMKSGAILVDMSTVSGEASEDVAEACAKQGVGYLCAPVSGSTAHAQAATLTIMVSGPSDVLSAVEPSLKAMSAVQYHVGEGHQARFLKLSINMLVGATAALMGEAMALSLKAGIDRDTMLDVMGASAIASPLVKYKVDMLKSQDYAPAFEVSQMAKDFDLILGAARASNTPMPMAGQVREGFSALIANGDGEEDFFKYVELASTLAGLGQASDKDGQS